MGLKLPPVLHVAIALIERSGRYLICRRPPGVFLGGYWEFPGGKLEQGESAAACLRRELREELGISVRAVKPFHIIRYRYASGLVRFQVFRCAISRGIPRPLEVSAVRWVTPQQLVRYKFPPADRSLIRMLSQPSRRGIIESR